MKTKMLMMMLMIGMLSALDAHAYVKFCNRSSGTLWVAYMNHSHACGSECGVAWDKAGWWGLSPGQCKVVYGGDAHYNRYHYYYAQSDRGLRWEGPYWQEVWYSAFRICTCMSMSGPSSFNVGFREINVGSNDNYTINLRG